jgi:murein DD-endopeptidase MepM/ murein hydrolase activator NlpD
LPHPLRLAVLAAALALPAPAVARDRLDSADGAASASLPAALPAAAALLVDAAPQPALAADDRLPPPRVRIAIGPEHVAAGAARYAARTAAPGKAAIVEFSATPPPPPGVAGAVGGLPAGLPLASARLTSGFGWRTHPLSGAWRPHSGVDLAAPYGSPIVATAGGVVGTAGWSGGYGLLVAVSHGDGVQTRYGHMSRLAVAPGQQVAAGQVIGYVGSTGDSTGPHLHYEVRIDGRAIDPLAR